ncbi:MAG TPA: response regulator [Thermoanaerobaculia bacterium]|jgi:DNA-binding response OmpR family regulator|nr:response regulator [Thermoanaerobaculia bacterium]
MMLPPRLLVVDDEAAILFAMADYLSRNGYEVDRASSREQAGRLLAAGSYALIVIDLRLGPHEPWGGLDLLRGLRGRQAETPAILLTAYGSAEVEAELGGLGAVRLLSKPLPLAQIAREVAELLAACHPESGRDVPILEMPDRY